MLEQRKFSICLELVHNDPIMIVDEPFIGLDLSSSLESKTNLDIMLTFYSNGNNQE